MDPALSNSPQSSLKAPSPDTTPKNGVKEFPGESQPQLSSEAKRGGSANPSPKQAKGEAAPKRTTTAGEEKRVATPVRRGPHGSADKQKEEATRAREMLESELLARFSAHLDDDGDEGNEDNVSIRARLTKAQALLEAEVGRCGKLHSIRSKFMFNGVDYGHI